MRIVNKDAICATKKGVAQSIPETLSETDVACGATLWYVVLQIPKYAPEIQKAKKHTSIPKKRNTIFKNFGFLIVKETTDTVAPDMATNFVRNEKRPEPNCKYGSNELKKQTTHNNRPEKIVILQSSMILNTTYPLS